MNSYIWNHASVAGAAPPPCLKVSGKRFGGWHAVTFLLPRCEQVFKRLVAYIVALFVLSPKGRPFDSRIVAIADARNSNDALCQIVGSNHNGFHNDSVRGARDAPRGTYTAVIGAIRACYGPAGQTKNEYDNSCTFAGVCWLMTK
jgi:hypothetical protein